MSTCTDTIRHVIICGHTIVIHSAGGRMEIDNAKCTIGESTEAFEGIVRYLADINHSGARLKLEINSERASLDLICSFPGTDLKRYPLGSLSKAQRREPEFRIRIEEANDLIAVAYD